MTDASLHEGSHGVALCMTGWHRSAVLQQGGYIRSRVVEPLGADVVMLLTYRRGEPRCEDPEGCPELRKIARLQPLTTLALEQMPTIGDLLQRLETLPHWSDILQAFNNTPHWRQFHTLRAKQSQTGNEGILVHLDTVSTI